MDLGESLVRFVVQSLVYSKVILREVFAGTSKEMCSLSVGG